MKKGFILLYTLVLGLICMIVFLCIYSTEIGVKHQNSKVFGFRVEKIIK